MENFLQRKFLGLTIVISLIVQRRGQKKAEIWCDAGDVSSQSSTVMIVIIHYLCSFR